MIRRHEPCRPCACRHSPHGGKQRELPRPMIPHRNGQPPGQKSRSAPSQEGSRPGSRRDGLIRTTPPTLVRSDLICCSRDRCRHGVALQVLRGPARHARGTARVLAAQQRGHGDASRREAGGRRRPVIDVSGRGFLALGRGLRSRLRLRAVRPMRIR